MRYGLLLLVCIVALADQARASEAPPHRENNPHMGAFSQPVEWERDNIRIEAPKGFPVCSVVESFSSLLMFFVPINPETPCEQFPLDSDWDKNPDFVVIDPYVDTPLDTPGIEEYIYKYQAFFCAGMRRPPKSDRAWTWSEAPTVRAPAGKRLLGLETVTCTRTDENNDRYSKAYVAYKPGSFDQEGRGYAVGAYVHIKNKQAADRLLEQVVNLIKPLK